MSKNYIEKVIEKEVIFEPDYSKIKEQVNIKPRKASKKRWVWPSLSIGLVSIAVIVGIIVFLSLRGNPTPTPTYDGVHFNNYTSSNSGSGNGEPSPTPPMVSYSIDVEKDNYEYNEEFIIKYTIKDVGGYAVADRNNLNVKIVSDKFEFLSPTDYHFDLDTDISTYGNILSFGEEYEDLIYPIEMELKVKAKEQTDNLENISFLLEFPLQDNFKEWVLQNVYEDIEETYKNGDDEFTKNLEWIHRLYYLNDELGTLLVDESKKFVYPSNDKEGDEVLIQPRTEIMYRSLNRLYEGNLISENDYIKRLIGYFTNNRTYFSCIIKSHIQDKYIVSYQYYSRNFRVYFDLNDENDFLFDLYRNNQEGHIQATKYFLKLIYEEGKISLDEYNNEIAIIDEKGVFKYSDWQEYIGRNWIITFDKCNSILVPFENYREYYFDLYIEV